MEKISDVTYQHADMAPPIMAPILKDIQRKQDGSYVVSYNGSPYHATENETPDVYQRVLESIKAGEKVVDYKEPVPDAPDPQVSASSELRRLRAVADYAITPLQDAEDVGEATAKEAADLKAWKQYRVLLNRVSEQPGYPKSIKWPVAPA